jgi:hypothetical protein
VNIDTDSFHPGIYGHLALMGYQSSSTWCKDHTWDFFCPTPALITFSKQVLCILVGLVVSPWKGSYRHQWYSNCVKLIHQIYNSCAVHCYTCTNVPCCMHWSTDMSSWHRIDYLIHRTTLNPGRSNRLWVCRVIAFQWWEWPLCHDNAIHVHTATRIVVVAGL